METYLRKTQHKSEAKVVGKELEQSPEQKEKEKCREIKREKWIGEEV